MADVTRVAPTTLAVLVTGETGAGKELVARAIHANSGRAGKPSVAVDCGAIPESLIERELFGHEKGAFTGAHRAVPGAFELANGGTLFLDEIGNLPLAVQGKLLRVLEERRIRRIGGTNELAVDFRVVAAANVGLREMVDQRAFRQDLYHRLAEFRIELPPLRERKEDIPHLVKRFMKLANRELGKNVRDLSAPALDMILAYDWPGNVRELRNQLRRAMLFVDDAEGVITPECLEIADRRNKASGHPRPQTLIPLGELAGSGPVDWWCKDCPLTAAAALLAREGAMPFKELVGRVIAQVERSILIRVLKQTNGNKAEAARLLRIDYKTIHSKLKEYGISTNPYKGQTEIKRKTQAEEVGHGQEEQAGRI
jgi:transcriptional regulator with GAF, ATPase, and Fis domain